VEPNKKTPDCSFITNQVKQDKYWN